MQNDRPSRVPRSGHRAGHWSQQGRVRGTTTTTTTTSSSSSRGSSSSSSSSSRPVTANSNTTAAAAATATVDSGSKDVCGGNAARRSVGVRRPSRYSSVRARIQVNRGRPVMRGFANVGAVFGGAKKDEIPLQVIRMARKSGVLNLSNKGFTQVPDKVYHINEIDSDEAKMMTMNMSMDGSDGDRWWEQVDLYRLYLSSNQLSCVSGDIRNLAALQVLDLSDNILSELPSSIGELSSLQRLSLSHNQLSVLPAGVFALQDLKSLQLDHNKFVFLHDDLGNLHLLEYLDVSHNCLTKVPASIGYLQRLSKCNASHNDIKELPLEIGDCFGMTQLDLTHNKLESIPESISNLSKLEQLYLRHNRLNNIPPLQSCVALKELYLGNNFIKEISEDQLSSLRSVRILDLRDNQVDNLPDEITLLQGLERLDIANNNLSTLPFHLGFLPHLKSMTLEGNPLRLIRRDIVQRGTLHILKYLRSRVPTQMHVFPGFDSNPRECNNLAIESSDIPDKYQMKRNQSVCYNEGVSVIPEQLFENAAEAEVRTVDLSKNTLTQLPTKLEVLSRHVCELVLGQNKLTNLPCWIGGFHRLQYLDLQNNQLCDLPSELSALLHLREINITTNRFESIPRCVYELGSLEILCAANNKIKVMDVEGLEKLKQLATLDLHNNNIDFVPPSLGNMKQLRTLVLHGNAFRVPRRAILDKGTQETLEYLRSRIVDE